MVYNADGRVCEGFSVSGDTLRRFPVAEITRRHYYWTFKCRFLQATDLSYRISIKMLKKTIDTYVVHAFYAYNLARYIISITKFLSTLQSFLSNIIVYFLSTDILFINLCWFPEELDNNFDAIKIFIAIFHQFTGRFSSSSFRNFIPSHCFAFSLTIYFATEKYSWQKFSMIFISTLYFFEYSKSIIQSEAGYNKITDTNYVRERPARISFSILSRDLHTRDLSC